MTPADRHVAWVLALSGWSWLTAWPWEADAAVIAILMGVTALRSDDRAPR
jgi:hypothetical protein